MGIERANPGRKFEYARDLEWFAWGTAAAVRPDCGRLFLESSNGLACDVHLPYLDDGSSAVPAGDYSAVRSGNGRDRTVIPVHQPIGCDDSRIDSAGRPLSHH